ncbi:MAG: NapC/NirT family cytochrome c, partial [Myxococcota bacterium]
VACHAATGNRTESDGALVVDLGAPLAGTHGGPAPHATSDRPFLRSSSLCATCHEVAGPGLLDERTGTEHAESGVSESCADCHFPKGSHATIGFEPGPEVDPEARALHTRSLLAEALALSVERDGDTWRIEVENVGAGHDVPTGAAVFRELRLDLVVDGVHTPLDTLGPRAVDAGGRPVALLTEAAAVDGAGLAPGEVHELQIPRPPDGAVVELVFRAWRADTTDALALERAPEVSIASAAPPDR